MRRIKLAVSTHWKRYIVSSAVSFVAAAITVLLGEVDNVSSFEGLVTNGVLYMAVRAGVKAVLESTLAQLKEMKKTEKPE